MKKFIFIFLFIIVSFPFYADELEEAIIKIENGELSEAKEILKGISSKNDLVNLYLGRIAFLEYDYPEATRLYSTVKSQVKNSDTYNQFQKQLQTGKQMLAHVEDIVVVDSIAVDSISFFKNYVLSSASGKIISKADIKKIHPLQGQSQIGFTNEFKDYMVWSAPDSAGYFKIYESSKLTDGNWSQPSAIEIPSEDEDIVDANFSYPFMLDDGLTLYYASDSSDSLGYYDIFVSAKDPYDGEFLEPRNLGMPFNSPYNDFMMAVDPLTGTGWWATDRNHIPGKLTIYVYILPESRTNIDPDDDDLISRARLNDFEITREGEEKVVKETLQAIASLSKASSADRDFDFPLTSKTRYYFFSDFKSREAAEKMRVYLKEKESLTKDLDKLSSLRKAYYLQGKPSNQTAEIKALEESALKKEGFLKKTLNEIYQLEKSKIGKK